MEKIYELRYGTRFEGSEVVAIGTKSQTQKAMREDLEEKGIDAPYFRSWNETDYLITDFGNHNYFFYLVEQGTNQEMIEEQEEELTMDVKRYERHRVESERELVFEDLDEALELMRLLIDNDYICVLSREKMFYVVQFTWAPYSDRNYLEIYNFA